MDLHKVFHIASSAGFIAAITNLAIRALIGPIFGIPDTTLYPLYLSSGLIMGFVSVLILLLILKLEVTDFKFAVLAPILGAVLLPIIRIYLIPTLFSIDPQVPVVDYVLIGFADMIITFNLLKFIESGDN